MTSAVTEIAVSSNSDIAKHLHGAYFADAYEVSIKRPAMTALEIYLSAVAMTPAWIERLMMIRNRVVSVFGLKNLGGLSAIDRTKPASAYRVGDRVGIFVIHSLSDQEAIFGDSDKHLNAKISVRKTGIVISGDFHRCSRPQHTGSRVLVFCRSGSSAYCSGDASKVGDVGAVSIPQRSVGAL
jgi:Protein of unknown function (DUF2867)